MDKIITLAQINEIAAQLEVEPAVVRAVIAVETAGPGRGFVRLVEPSNPVVAQLLASTGFVDHPVVLFERHIFFRLTSPESNNSPLANPFVQSHPDLCNPKPGGYAMGRDGQTRRAREIDRLYRAVALNREMALCSASWGLPQIMGFNYETCGCDSVEEFVEQMMIDELSQMKLFVTFIRRLNLDDLLRQRNWVAFARRYNGPLYEKNRYHTRLATAYAQIKGEG